MQTLCAAFEEFDEKVNIVDNDNLKISFSYYYSPIYNHVHISYCHSLKDTSNMSRCTLLHVYCFFVSRQRNTWFLFFCSRFHAAGWPWSPGGREGALIISSWFVPCLESRKESVSFLASSLGSLDFGG